MTVTCRNFCPPVWPSLHSTLCCPAQCCKTSSQNPPGVERQVLRVDVCLGSSPQSLLWGPYTNWACILPPSLQLLCGLLWLWPCLNSACHYWVSRVARGRRHRWRCLTQRKQAAAATGTGRAGDGTQGGGRGSSYCQGEPCTNTL